MSVCRGRIHASLLFRRPAMGRMYAAPTQHPQPVAISSFPVGTGLRACPDCNHPAKDNHGGPDNPVEGLSLRLQKIAITIRKDFFNNPVRAGTLAPPNLDEEPKPAGEHFCANPDTITIRTCDTRPPREIIAPGEFPHGNLARRLGSRRSRLCFWFAVRTRVSTLSTMLRSAEMEKADAQAAHAAELEKNMGLRSDVARLESDLAHERNRRRRSSTCFGARRRRCARASAR